MKKYTDEAIEAMKAIVDAAKEGKTFRMGSERDAVNLRQRIYNYRKSALKDEETPARQKDLLGRLSVRVKGKHVMVTVKPVDYLSRARQQIGANDE